MQLGSKIGSGKDYDVYHHPTCSTHVVKIPKDTRRSLISTSKRHYEIIFDFFTHHQEPSFIPDTIFCQEGSVPGGYYVQQVRIDGPYVEERHIEDDVVLREQIRTLARLSQIFIQESRTTMMSDPEVSWWKKQFNHKSLGYCLDLAGKRGRRYVDALPLLWYNHPALENVMIDPTDNHLRLVDLILIQTKDQVYNHINCLHLLR